MDTRDRLLYWWPVVARYAGAPLVAAYGLTIGPAENLATTLAFAAGLLVAPNIFPSKNGNGNGSGGSK